MKKEKKEFKAIIICYVLAFVCITSWIAFGVALAFTSVNIDVDGNISFTANDVYADVTGTVTGTATTNTLEDIHLSADTTSFTTPSSWSNIKFTFFNGQDIVFTINFTNKSTERSLWVSVTDSISATNATIKRKSAGTAVNSLDTLEVPKSTSKSVEITLHISNLNKSASGKFALGLNLTSEEPAYPTLVFTYNDSAKTATVRQNYSNEPTGDLDIPSSVLHNGEEYSVTGIYFAYCSGLTSVTIPSSVTSIGSSAFRDCSSLTSITIPETVRTIGTYAFYRCSALTSITIPESVSSIEVYAFYGCSALTSITLPRNVAVLRDSVFENCSSLTSVTLPTIVSVIGYRTFKGCSALTSITILRTETIGSEAFYGCSKLTSVTFGSATNIGTNAFSGCSKLTSATFKITAGWKADSTTLSSSDLADTSKAATFLTSTYVNSTWTRS